MKKISVFLCFAIIFASLFGGSVYAALDETTFPGYGNGYAEYVSYTGTNDTLHLFKITSPDGLETKLVDVLAVDNTGNYVGTWTVVLKTKQKINVQHYQKTSGYNGSWMSTTDNFSVDANMSRNLDSYAKWFNYSTYDVKSASDDSVLFMGSLVEAPTLEETILEGIMNLQTKTVGTMKTLTVCGVGLLALLIGLVILPKILFRFL